MKYACICKNKNKENWIVINRNCNYSYFQYPKGCKHYSDYSLLKCLACGNVWRTKAKYVCELKNGTFSDALDIKEEKENKK